MWPYVVSLFKSTLLFSDHSFSVRRHKELFSHKEANQNLGRFHFYSLPKLPEQNLNGTGSNVVKYSIVGQFVKSRYYSGIVLNFKNCRYLELFFLVYSNLDSTFE